jgi:release factor glutamine methyltransferase
MSAWETADLVRAAAERLGRAGVDEPLREARLLARKAIDAAAFDAFIARREKREPVAYILGRKEFWSLELEVTPAVLIPRPDTETVVEAALAELKQHPPSRILDLGTGSGAIILALLSEWPHATGLAVDRSAEALAVAHRNARRHRLVERIVFREGDWAEGIAERFALVVSNPPYIADDEFATLDPDVRDHEPASALKAGPQGLDAYARIAAALPALLTANGRAVIEIGHAQAAPVAALFTKSGLEVVRIVKDLAAHDRVVVARLPHSPGA